MEFLVCMEECANQQGCKVKGGEKGHFAYVVYR